MKKLMAALFLLIAAAGGAFAYLDQSLHSPPPESLNGMSFAPYPSQKVVYHISGGVGLLGRNFDQPLGNIANHVRAFGSNPFALEVVINGDGIGMLTRAKTEKHLSDRIDALRAKGVTFKICYNTLKERRLDPDKDLYKVERQDIVASGVAQVAALQGQGYIYMKP